MYSGANLLAIRQIEDLAFNWHELPDGLTLPEQMYFLALRNLFKSRRLGINSEETLCRERIKVENAFSNGGLWFAIYKNASEKERLLNGHYAEMYKSGCPLCRRTVEILTGLDKGGQL